LGDQGCDGLTGKYSLADALTELLAKSGLTFKAVSASSIAIQRKAATGNTPIGVSRVAEVRQASEPAPSSGEPLQEIVVTAKYEFLSADTSGTTNLPLPIEKVPQSISLVSNDFIKAADLKSLGEIAEYTPGAVNVGNQENTGSLIFLRGFSSGRAVDGIDLINQGFNFYEPDYAIFDRLEIVKGPSSVVYGVSSPGGVVNYVTKSATSQTPSYAMASFGSWDSYRFEGQLAHSLDSEGRVRAIGIAVYDQGNSFVADLYHKKATLYGGINIDFTDSLTGYLHGGYERLERPSFDGIPAEPDGTPAPLPYSFFMGSENIISTSNVYHTEGDLTWHATRALDFSVKGNYESVGISGGEVYSFGLAPSGDVGIEAAKFNPFRDDNYGAGASALYRFDLFGTKDSFVSVSALYQHSTYDLVSDSPANTGTVNISAGQAAVSQAFDALLSEPLSSFAQKITASTFTGSAQSVLKVSDRLAVLAGLSYSKPDVEEVVDGSGQNFSIGGQMSYRGGLTYEVLPGTDAYLSYSQSFNPQTFLTTSNTPLPPLEGEQYEAGIKYRAPNSHLLLTGSLFQIKEKNVAEFAAAIDGIEYYAPLGQVKHRGVELQALGQVTPEWQINAGYTFLDPTITEDANPATVGETQLFIPKETLSVYSTYSLSDGRLHGLSFGGGIRYVGDQRTSYRSALANSEAGLTPSKDLPSYILVDLSASYTIDKWLFQLNVHNALDKHYFINNWQTLFYGNMPGDPANATLSVRYTF
jgi:TonB-dependent siderophore receptor